MKKDIAVTIIITSYCNMRCKYCINDSGNDLQVDCGKSQWNDYKEIVMCLKKISETRNISTIKLFGGEPLLNAGIVEELVNHKSEFSDNENLKFALTTNGLCEINDGLLDCFVKNHVILNISLDGPDFIHNEYRICNNGANSYEAVRGNLNKLDTIGYPYALIAVLDERIITSKFSLYELCCFLGSITPSYKIEPAYDIKNENLNLVSEIKGQLLKQETDLINNLFKAIKSLDIDHFLYENNILRTIYNAVYNKHKEYVCSAADHIAIFPNMNAYSCYNLLDKDFLICKDLSAVSSGELDNILTEKKNKLALKNFPDEYKDVEFFGDYCPRENNYESFAYCYRKSMVDVVSENLKTIKVGSAEHLALLGYLAKGYEQVYYKNTVDNHGVW